MSEHETEADVSESDMGESGKCLHVDCDADADVAAICDTGQIKHYCDEHGHGRMAGISRAEEWVEL